jgi:hypothetical protein
MEDLMEKLDEEKMERTLETRVKSHLAQHPRPSGCRCSAAVVHCDFLSYILV